MSPPVLSAPIVVVKRPRGGLFATVRSVPVWLRSLARGESVARGKPELGAEPRAVAQDPPTDARERAVNGGVVEAAGASEPAMAEQPSSPEQAALRAGLTERGAVVVEGADAALVAELPAPAVGALLRWLRDEPSFSFDVLYDLTVVDRLPGSPRFEVVYGLRSSARPSALRVRARIEVEPPEIESVTSLWRSADWLEREAHDLFDVRFVGHPGLHPILLPPDFVGAPLRHDFEPAADAGEGAGS